MKTVFRYLKRYRVQSILAPVFKMLEALMDLIVPLVVADIIDVGIAGGNRPYIYQRIVLLIFLALLGMLFSFTAQYFAARASVGATTLLRQDLFDHIESLSYTQIDFLGTSTLITRMTSDCNQVQTGLNMALRLLLRSPFIVFGAMIMPFTIDVRCALIFAVAIPVLAVVVLGIMLGTIPMYRNSQAQLDVILNRTRENLTGVRVLRAFCKEDEEVRRFDEENSTLTKMNEKVGRISALLNPLSYFLIQLATIILIQAGAIRVNLGALQQGDVVALYNYMAQIVVELIKLASLIITINRAIASAERVSKVLGTEPDMTYPATSKAFPDTDEAVSFDHVHLAYQGAGAESLTDITFTAKKGQTIGIIGGTGSGKSSLVNLIPRFYDATGGSVKIGGVDVKDLARKDLVNLIGVVPQKAQLFQGTIRDNLKLGNESASDDELNEALVAAQAKEVVDKKDGGLDAMVEQSGRNFSGGQKQRLTIARALAKHPKILILDDSASALDFATEAALRKAIGKLTGTTVFLVSQRTTSVKHADQILVLDDGTLAGKGTHEELMKTCPVYQEIYYSQFPEERKEAKA